jgi:hypothetical protein
MVLGGNASYSNVERAEGDKTRAVGGTPVKKNRANYNICLVIGGKLIMATASIHGAKQ